MKKKVRGRANVVSKQALNLEGDRPEKNKGALSRSTIGYFGHYGQHSGYGCALCVMHAAPEVFP